jgi:TorA maturation chaperone TorD
LDLAELRKENEDILWSAHLEARRLLAVVLCQPDRDTLVQEGVVPRLVAAFKELAPGTTEPMDAFLVALDNEGQEALLTEYTRLFIGPDTLPAPPYGSVHLEPGRQVLGETTEAVRQFYAEEELVVSDGVNEPPDHIALEFEFAAFLLEKAATAWTNGSRVETNRLLKTARDFETAFLRSWLPDLATSIEAAAETAFYTGVARSLLAYCKTEMPILRA